jgi:hypothetical protein
MSHVSNVHLLINPFMSAATRNAYTAVDAAGLAPVGHRAGCEAG